MRTEQDQLIDLTEVILEGAKNIRRKRHIKYAYPIVLEGLEGVLLRDLMALVAMGDKDKSDASFQNSVFFEKSPVFCSEEFSLPEEKEKPLGLNIAGEYSGAHGDS